jgi:hypothetical protein
MFFRFIKHHVLLCFSTMRRHDRLERVGTEYCTWSAHGAPTGSAAHSYFVAQDIIAFTKFAHKQARRGTAPANRGYAKENRYAYSSARAQSDNATTETRTGI